MAGFIVRVEIHNEKDYSMFYEEMKSLNFKKKIKGMEMPTGVYLIKGIENTQIVFDLVNKSLEKIKKSGKILVIQLSAIKQAEYSYSTDVLKNKVKINLKDS